MALLNRSKPVYTDIDMSFNINPVTKDVTLVNDYYAVAQSIHNIITSHKLWNFDNLGMGNLIFNNYADPLVGTVILTNLEKYVKEREPRIDTLSINNMVILSSQMVRLDVVFSLKTNNNSTYNTNVFVAVTN